MNCVIVYGRTSCKTASGWWVILIKYVLIKIKIKICRYSDDQDGWQSYSPSDGRQGDIPHLKDYFSFLFGLLICLKINSVVTHAFLVPLIHLHILSSRRSISNDSLHCHPEGNVIIDSPEKNTQQINVVTIPIQMVIINPWTWSVNGFDPL